MSMTDCQTCSTSDKIGWLIGIMALSAQTGYIIHGIVNYDTECCCAFFDHLWYQLTLFDLENGHKMGFWCV